ncbi:MAG: DNA topoisomerase IV subunit A [SAR116 cluster bacterium MED-G04]|jgi:topoisomerase-4 subunit A|nr:DNA topoisomerase IV subunit A [SAR116 cluster bacterium]PDH65764.1 MAG: DNA topoisomerase IV subunit A [SAR116 cluster bacterium MED-G04]|tara:strand:- start:1848 stop:4061 length:2214 start_codon:yes stop_codon:yes gene_type:complete
MADQQSTSTFIQAEFADALSQRYLAYALSTITSRSLPDVRDGLKPVHRRLLFAMRQLKLDPGQGYKKSARVVGDVMGKFHPHGDAAIYDAMVRLAQEFAMRYPLVDGQGNFGNIDGDNAAAMRYTEARMSNVARLLLDGIDEDAVDFRATYDGESEEPVILPAAFPNLLANGAQGIAVGMATSIPPHNVLELADAILHLIRYPNAGHDTISGFVKGPDFPTGGVLVEDPATIAEAYQTGRGSFRVRADWTVEKEKGGAWKIIVTAIPYQVQKSRLVEKMAEMLNDKKLPVLADIRDESAEDLRLVLEPKSRRIDPVLMMESLFKLTDLESRVSLNLNVLDASGKPGVLSLKSALLEWIDHRLVVLQRRSRYRLGKIASRLEVLEGYLVVYLNLDEVIAIIREEDNPKTRLMERFGLNENQANAILDMRLRSLRKLEEMEIRGEREKLEEEKTGLTSLLADEDQQRRSVARDVKSLKTDFARIDQRRTRLDSVPEVEGDPMDMLVEKEPITVICSEKGWIRAAKGHLASDAEVKFKEGDGPAFMVHAETTDRILVAADNGRFYTLSADKLPGGRGFGEPVSLMVELGADTTIINLFPARGGEILIVADTGHGFITATDQVMAQTRNGKQVLTLPKGVKAAVARPAIGDMVAVVGSNRKLLVFPRDDLPVMGRGRGVMLQRYRDGTLGDARCFNRADGLSWVQSGGRNRTEPDTTPWQGKRGSAGRVAPTGFPRPARFT